MHEQSMHSRFGGSVAARVLNCPASIGLVEQVPAHLRKTSSYAERGTALHAAMALLIDDLDASKARLDGLAGTTIGNYTITADDVQTALAPALAYIDALLVPGAEFYLERRVAFPTVAGAFGTADLLVRIGNTAYVIDHKFGAGVRVLALRPDGDDDVINAQLMFYATGARHTHPEFFAGVETIVLVIVQPVSIEPDAEMVSSVAVTPAELDAFVVTYAGAWETALSDTPPLARGDWCRFCPARPICPAHTSPLLDLAHFELPTPGPDNKEAYLQALADGLNLVDAVKDISLALRDQAKSALQNDDVVSGYVLSAGRAERHWYDENAAMAALIRAGFPRTDVIAEAMRSPRQVELRAKARGLEVPPELISSQRSGVSLVNSENAHAPMPGRRELVRLFSEALQAFQKEGGKHDCTKSRPRA
jgi:Protein of unknown function (DUF2800)